MDSQLTPVHTHLWHHGFSMLLLGCMLLTVSAYMQVPALQVLLPGTVGHTGMAWLYVLFAIGLFVPGPLVSFLVDRYRRNWVCIWAIMGYAATVTMLASLHVLPLQVQWGAAMAVRLVQGALYGLAQMVMVSTLVTDCCESGQRSAANYSAAWMQRLGMALGPVMGCLALLFCIDDLALVIAGTAVMAVVLVFLVGFPFKAPEDNSFHFSWDRFWLKGALPLAAHVFVLGLVLGLLVSANGSVFFYSLLTAGFFVALAGRMMMPGSRHADAWVLAGLGLTALALSFGGDQDNALLRYMVPVMAGCGVGMAAARLQMLFILVCRHCQRGTSQSCYWLAWESGALTGMALVYACKDGARLTTALLYITVTSLAVFASYTRGWYKKRVCR